METSQIQTKKVHYKYCIVPMCGNTTVTTPDKYFFNVPKKKNLRAKWCRIMKRIKSLSDKSVRYCCEDHFDVETDTENYMRFRLMGGTLFLKKHVLPHKFDCQSTKEKPKERSVVVKRRLVEFYERVLSMDIPISVAQQPIEFIECVPSDEVKKDPENPISIAMDCLDEDKKTSVKVKTINKGIQVNIKAKKTDKSCQTNFRKNNLRPI